MGGACGLDPCQICPTPKRKLSQQASMYHVPVECAGLTTLRLYQSPANLSVSFAPIGAILPRVPDVR